MHFQDVSPELLRRVVEVSDFGVRVETENTWCSENWDGIDEFEVGLVGFFIGDHVIVVDFGEVELLIGVKDEVTKEFL